MTLKDNIRCVHNVCTNAMQSTGGDHSWFALTHHSHVQLNTFNHTALQPSLDGAEFSSQLCNMDISSNSQ